jgi:membrane-associated phospholipid phosphatase
MGAGAHFFSDVLVGAVVGSLTGFIVPYLHSVTGFPFNGSTKKENTLMFSVGPDSVSAVYWL